MMAYLPLFMVAIIATALDGLLAGASLDQSIKQLPARRRIGAVAYSVYARAADLGTGIIWYAALGIGSALLTIVSAIVALAQSSLGSVALPLYLAAAVSVAHSFTTLRAAPTMLAQRHIPAMAENEPELRALFDRFERWQMARVILQVVTFMLMLWTLAAFPLR
jgi:heme A synthase